MKNLLVITLLFSSFGFGSSMQKLECVKTFGDREMSEKHYLRIDLDNEKLWLNLSFAHKIRFARGTTTISETFSDLGAEWDLKLNRSDLKLQLGMKKFNFTRISSFYQCKLI